MRATWELLGLTSSTGQTKKEQQGQRAEEEEVRGTDEKVETQVLIWRLSGPRSKSPEVSLEPRGIPILERGLVRNCNGIVVHVYRLPLRSRKAAGSGPTVFRSCSRLSACQEEDQP